MLIFLLLHVSNDRKSCSHDNLYIWTSIFTTPMSVNHVIDKSPSCSLCELLDIIDTRQYQCLCGSIQCLSVQERNVDVPWNFQLAM